MFAVTVSFPSAMDSFVTVGLDYASLSVQNINTTLYFVGAHSSFYSFVNEFSNDGFLARVSFQGLVSITTSSEGGSFTFDVEDSGVVMMNALVGYARRIELGRLFDVAIGTGPTFLLFGSEDGKATAIGLGIHAEFQYLLSPKMLLNAGLGINFGAYDLGNKKLFEFEDSPMLIRPYVAVGFRF